MTSRERLLKAIKFEKTDRVPISTYELCGWNSLSFENQEPSYATLMDHIRQNTDCVCMWSPEDDSTLAESAYPIKIDTDKRYKDGRTTVTEKITIAGRELSKITVSDDNILTTWIVKHWCEDLEDVDAIMSIDFIPLSYSYSDYKRITSEVGDKGIIMDSVGDPICMAAELMEFGNYTIWAMTEREHFKKTLDRIYERMEVNLERRLSGQTVDLYRICGPEYCTVPYLPPELYSEYVTPYVKEITSMIHRHGGLARLHSHGKIRDCLSEMMKTGADATDPVEDEPDGNTKLADVKRIFNGKMSIFGNVQLKLLETGTKQDVRNYVRYSMDSAKEGGGYIIMPTAAPITLPLADKIRDNYFELIDAALEYGKY